MWQFLGFWGLSSENRLFYSVLRRPAMFEMAHHKPTKCLLLRYLQLVPAKFLVNKAFSICRLHFTLFFLGVFRKPKMPHYTWRYQPHVYIYIYISLSLSLSPSLPPLSLPCPSPAPPLPSPPHPLPPSTPPSPSSWEQLLQQDSAVVISQLLDCSFI